MSEFTGEIHPFAARFPMLSADDMDALVESIAHVGQTDPILLDTDGRLLDGRNRLEACQRLGIDPVFRTVETDAPESVINSRNALTKPLSTGQRAMAVAMELVARGLRDGGRWEYGALNRTDLSDSGVARVKQAGYIIDRDPPLADAVLLGAIPLSKAYEDTKKLQAKSEKETAQLATIAAKAPDLYERVVDEDDPTDVAEAHAAYEVRFAEEIAQRQREIDSADQHIDAVKRFIDTARHWAPGDGYVPKTVEQYQRLRSLKDRALRPQIDRASIKEAIAGLTRLMEEWPND